MYLPLEQFWPEINEKIDKARIEIRQVQLILSTMESTYFKNKFGGKEKNISKASLKIRKWMTNFTKKIMNTKKHANFDVFIEVHKETTNILKDIKKVHEMVGPNLAYIYAAQIFNKLSSLEPKDMCPEELEERERKQKEELEKLRKAEEKEKLRELQQKLREDEFKEEEEEKNKEGSNDFFDELNKTLDTENTRFTEAIRMDNQRETSTRTGFYAKGEGEESKPDHHFEVKDTRQPSVSVNIKGMRTLSKVPQIRTLGEIENEEEDIGPGTKMVTVFAATMNDFSNCNINYQKLVDFMAKLRDHNIDCREEVDGYLRKYNLQPSKKYLQERITPNIPEIEDAIHEHKIAKNFTLNSESKLVFDFKKKGKY